MGERLLSTAEVQERTGLGRTTIWRMERNGEFPLRRQLVGQRVGWVESEVDGWIADRPVASAVTSDPEAA